MRSLLSAFVFIPAFLLCLNASVTAQESGTGGTEEKICRMHSVSMNRICKEWDGQWQGITVGSDGACYFGSSTHSKSHGAGFHKFEPETKTHTLLAKRSDIDHIIEAIQKIHAHSAALTT